jgi:hypothetical protein
MDESQLIGFYITAGASVLVSIIGGAFMVRAKRQPPPPDPVPITAVWEENRKVHQEIAETRKQFRQAMAALDVFARWAQRVVEEWGGPTPPAFTPREVEILEQAGAEIPYDPDWDDEEDPAMTGQPKER